MATRALLGALLVYPRGCTCRRRLRATMRRSTWSSGYRSRNAASGAEAIFRWERASKIDPTYAARVRHNLAIAYEHQGELDKARSAYEKALELGPDNALIKQNYELFKEINDRSSHRDQWRRRRPADGRVHELLRDSNRDADSREARYRRVPAMCSSSG